MSEEKKEKIVKKEKKEKKPKKLWQKILITIGYVVLALVLCVALLFTWLTITEYKPADVEQVAVEGETGKNAAEGSSAVRVGESMTVMSWNIGYGALGDNADFFMDGGKGVKTADKARLNQNLDGIIKDIAMVDPDVIFLQEVDLDSARSEEINEAEKIKNALNESREEKYISTFAYNYKVKFIPYPIPPIGKVNGGILTLSDFDITSSERVQLPCPFSWPVRLGNLKRCLMVDRVPVLDQDGNPSGKELVLVNLHLEAYDSGEGKAAQTEMLKKFLQDEVDKGNYVIAGGDFNQTFSNVDRSKYPEYEGKWHCGEIDVNEFGDDFTFIMDDSTPSCRSLDQSYVDAEKDDFQYYLIDGYIISKNIDVDYYFTIGLNFVNTDHNPVVMSVSLKPED